MKYPDIEAFMKWSRILRTKTQNTKYFEIDVELGCTDADLNEAFGKWETSKPTW